MARIAANVHSLEMRSTRILIAVAVATLVALLMDLPELRHAHAMPLDWHGWPRRAAWIQHANLVFAIAVLGTLVGSTFSLLLIDRSRGFMKVFLFVVTAPTAISFYLMVVQHLEHQVLELPSRAIVHGPFGDSWSLPAGMAISLVLYAAIGVGMRFWRLRGSGNKHVDAKS